MFKSIGGTSIGGILAGSLSASRDQKRPVINSQECVDLFHNHASSIFGRSRNRIDPMGLYTSKYDPQGIDSVINKYVQGIKLSECLVNLVIPAVYKDSYAMNVFRTVDALVDPDKDYLLQQVIKSTAAAPCFFPAVDVVNVTGSNQFTLIDGGVGKNDPSSFVMNDLVLQHSNTNMYSSQVNSNFCLLSFGCGENTEEKLMGQQSGLSDVSKVINKLLCTHTNLDQQEIIQKYGQQKYLRFQTILDVKDFKSLEIDCCDTTTLNKYIEKANLTSEQFYETKYGPYQDRSLVEWIAENTDRSLEML